MRNSAWMICERGVVELPSLVVSPVGVLLNVEEGFDSEVDEGGGEIFEGSGTFGEESVTPGDLLKSLYASSVACEELNVRNPYERDSLYISFAIKHSHKISHHLSLDK